MKYLKTMQLRGLAYFLSHKYLFIFFPHAHLQINKKKYVYIHIFIKFFQIINERPEKN